MNEIFDFENIRSNALGDYDDADKLKSLGGQGGWSQPFYKTYFYKDFYEFYKEILINKDFKYKIFKSGTTTTLLYIFSKIIENEIDEQIDYSNIYDSTILYTNQLNVQTMDKILFIEDIICENFKLSSDILLLEKKYDVSSSNVFVTSLSVDKNGNHCIENLLNINRFGEVRKSSSCENRNLLNQIRRITECICSNMNIDEYQYSVPITFDCDALYYWNKSNVISANYFYPGLSKNYKFNFEFYPTIKLEDLKKFLIENQLLKEKSVDKLGNNELKAIFDIIMLNKYQENKLRGCSYLYNIQDFDYEKFNQMDFHASDFDKYIDENEKFYGEFTNISSKFIDSIRLCTHANAGYDLINEIGNILIDMASFNEKVSFPQILNRDGEYIVETYDGSLPIYAITYYMKEFYYPERYYFLVLSQLTKMYRENSIDIKAEIFKDFDQNMYIGPSITSNKNLWHYLDYADNYHYHPTNGDFEIEKEKVKVKNLK